MTDKFIFGDRPPFGDRWPPLHGRQGGRAGTATAVG